MNELATIFANLGQVNCIENKVLKKYEANYRLYEKQRKRVLGGHF